MIFRTQVLDKLNAYFKQKLGLRDYRNGWLKGTCPMCGREDKFGINLIKDRANCFVCGENTRPLDLVLKLEDFNTRRDLWVFLRNIEALERVDIPVKPLELKGVQLPESFRLINLGKSVMGDLARDYLKSRGFNILSLAYKGVGYCTRGDYAGCIIFPCYAEGTLVYFIGRRFVNKGEKFKNPTLEDIGIGKSQIIANSDALYIYKKVQVVESYTNALTLGDTAIATFGKVISNYQLSTIIRSPIEEVELILDSDAYEEALKVALKLVLHKRLKLIKMPKDQDVNDLGKKATKELIKASSWMSYTDVHKAMVFHKSLQQYEEDYS
jgi:hypothetical protein